MEDILSMVGRSAIVVIGVSSFIWLIILIRDIDKEDF
jgi:hypothetical protein